jgi:hypothetical protein
VLDDGDQRVVAAHEAGPVPADAEVRVQAEPDVPADPAVQVGEVHVPRLVPERLGPGLVAVFVLTGDDVIGGHLGSSLQG